jgi:hypothetical protein
VALEELAAKVDDVPDAGPYGITELCEAGREGGEPTKDWTEF